LYIVGGGIVQLVELELLEVPGGIVGLLPDGLTNYFPSVLDTVGWVI